MEKIKIDWFRGVRVLLSANYLPGAIAGFMLSSLGAEVIKIESPDFDPLRKMPPFLKGKEGQMSAYFRALNQGVKSMVVNLKTEEGKSIFKGLVSNSDALIDGNRNGFLENLSGGPLNEVNPDFLHVPITAYGTVGPMKDQAGHDNNALALSGTLGMNPKSENGKSGVFSSPVADTMSGILAAFAVVGSLLGKSKNVASSHIPLIDTSILHSAFFLNHFYLAGMNADGINPTADNILLSGSLANYTSYFTQDEKEIFFGPLEVKLFHHFCDTIDRQDLKPLVFAQNELLKAKLNVVFAQKTRKEWKKTLENCDCCFTAVQTLKEGIEHPQIQALGLSDPVMDPDWGPLLLVGFPAGFGRKSLQPELNPRVPTAGEHTAEVLTMLLGYSEEEIASLKSRKIAF